MSNSSFCLLTKLPTLALNYLSRETDNSCHCCCIDQKSDQNRVYITALASLAFFAGALLMYVINKRKISSNGWIRVKTHSATIAMSKETTIQALASQATSDAIHLSCPILATRGIEFLVGAQQKLNSLNDLKIPNLSELINTLIDKINSLKTTLETKAKDQPQLQEAEIAQLNILESQVTALYNCCLCVRRATAVTSQSPNLIPLARNLCQELDKFNGILTNTFKEAEMKKPVTSLLSQIAFIKENLRQIQNPPTASLRIRRR